MRGPDKKVAAGAPPESVLRPSPPEASVRGAAKDPVRHRHHCPSSLGGGRRPEGWQDPRPFPARRVRSPSPWASVASRSRPGPPGACELAGRVEIHERDQRQIRGPQRPDGDELHPVQAADHREDGSLPCRQGRASRDDERLPPVHRHERLDPPVGPSGDGGVAALGGAEQTREEKGSDERKVAREGGHVGAVERLGPCQETGEGRPRSVTITNHAHAREDALDVHRQRAPARNNDLAGHVPRGGDDAANEGDTSDPGQGLRPPHPAGRSPREHDGAPTLPFRHSAPRARSP